MATTLPLASFDCFSDVPFGGSVAMIVSDAAGLDEATMRRMAREFAAPATCFIQQVFDDAVHVRFFSPVAELPMCGHGTMGLFTKLLADGELSWKDADRRRATLVTPIRASAVDLIRMADDRPRVLLDLKLPAFEAADVDPETLAELLGTTRAAFDNSLPLETAGADFVHLPVAMASLEALSSLRPNFAALGRYCIERGIGTVIAYSMQPADASAAWRCRDFCPAVGVDEAPAVGTSNGALACYLVRHGVLRPDAGGRIAVHAEQGLEVGRPSRIHVEMEVMAGAAIAVRVGGMATRIISGSVAIAG
mgnify:CR=1 FL=1